MSEFQDFLLEDFAEAESVERMIKLAGKERKMIFKPITASVADEIRKSCRKVTYLKGQKTVTTDQDAYLLKIIIETTVSPCFKSKALQDAWGVLGAENLLQAMKTKMLDGEYAELCEIVTELNGYGKSMNELVEDAKN